MTRSVALMILGLLLAGLAGVAHAQSAQPIAGRCAALGVPASLAGSRIVSIEPANADELHPCGIGTVVVYMRSDARRIYLPVAAPQAVTSGLDTRQHICLGDYCDENLRVPPGVVTAPNPTAPRPVLASPPLQGARIDAIDDCILHVIACKRSPSDPLPPSPTSSPRTAPGTGDSGQAEGISTTGIGRLSKGDGRRFPGPGSFTRTIDDLGGCSASEITVVWKFENFFGGGFVSGGYSWSGQAGCRPSPDPTVWLKVQAGEVWGWARLSPLPPSAGQPPATTGSIPEWNRMFCSIGGVRCLDAESAKLLWLNGKVTAFEVN